MADTKLQPHQQRVSDRIAGGESLLAYHSLGSGKTLESLDAARRVIEKGGKVLAIVPAPLKENMKKELDKHGFSDHVKGNIHIESYEKVAKEPSKYRNHELLILDEAHRVRNPGKRTQAIKEIASSAKQRLLLTGTPIYNKRYDIAKVVNMAANEKVLPIDEREFDEKFTKVKVHQPSLLGRLKMEPATYETVIKNKALLRRIGKKYIDHYDAQKANPGDFPRRVDEVVRVELPSDQMKYYNLVAGKLPWLVRKKMELGMPMSKKELGDLNAFSTGVRQVSNTSKGYGGEHTTKIDRVAKDFLEMAKDKRHKGVIYSNYIESGLRDTYEKLKDKVPSAMFTGAISKKEQKRIIEDYNSGKIRALLLSSAGSEGLDLKGTRSIQAMEPHFNNEKINQIIGRGIRYKSHSDLPEEERSVKVLKYLATKPKIFGKISRGQGIDEYLYNMAADKDKIHRDLLKALVG